FDVASLSRIQRYVLFSQCSPRHRELPSFPTRRSSDLIVLGMMAAGQDAYPRTSYPDARILVADRRFEGSELLASILERGGYKNILPVTRTTALSGLVSDLEPHVLLLSVATPGFSALGALRQLTRTAGDKYR